MGLKLFLYGIEVVLVYISPMLVAYDSSNIASYSSKISESLYVAEVSPMHKITFYEEFNSGLTIEPSLSPYGYTGCLKKSRSIGIANLLSSVFLMAFPWVVTVSAVPSDFCAPICALRPFSNCIA